MTECERIAKYLEEEAARLYDAAKMMGMWGPQQQAKHAGYLECASLVRNYERI